MENDTSERIWPATGIWAASYRVMFPLVALWAMVSVAIWHWGDFVMNAVRDPFLWHLHEMTFGLGGGALLGYLLSACSSWTGRAPVSGWRIVALAGLWGAARLAMLFSASWPIGLVAGLNVAVLWALAMVLVSEAVRGAKGKIWGYIGFVTVAGGVSGFAILGAGSGLVAGLGAGPVVWPGPIIAPVTFAVLLTVVGGRMAHGFLQSDAARRGLSPAVDFPSFGLIGAGALALAMVFLSKGQDPIAGYLVLLCAALQLIRMAMWQMLRGCGNTLLAMLMVGFAWLPIGLTFWGLALAGVDLVPQAGALHAAMMGALSSLIMSVAARPVAIRGANGLVARRGTLAAFICLQLAIFLRVFDFQTGSALAWISAWAIFLVVLLAGLRQPIPRPIFSGSRQSANH